MLTAKQQKLLQYITNQVSKLGISPSFDEMKDALGLKSKSGIHRLVGALEERRFIRRLANRARAIEILRNTDGSKYMNNTSNYHTSNSNTTNSLRENMESFSHRPNNDTVSIPLWGKIAAGTPIDAISTPDYNMDVPMSMLGNAKEHYALEVEGDSMIEAGILEGDTVLIEKCNTARDGDIVVALVDREETTLKTLYKKSGEIHLEPENKDFKTQKYTADRVVVQGRLVGLLRKY